MAETNPSGRRLLNLAKTADKVGSSTASVRRWSQDPATGFAEPVNIHNKLFWFEDEVDAWMESQPRVSKKPSVLQGKDKRIAESGIGVPPEGS
jgi:predicted DNA-binding transcriptional regulator AlpA